jgi:CheY-like chemotaxis protein
VRDAGVGIAPEFLARVFDMFVQGARGPHGGPGGLGLGLTLVRRIAELHGGSVEAASDGPGCGSTFTVRLPAMAAPPAPGAPAARSSSNGSRRRIVIVEDNADAREMLRVALELSGHEVHEAHDGPSGLAAILALRPDVALVDVGLPELDGYEVARKVRAQPATAVHLVGADRVRAAGRPAAGARRGIRRAPGEAGAPRRAARGHRGGRGRVLKRVKSPLAVV